MPESVANPRTEAQQAHRNAFAAISKLSSDLKEAHQIGLHKMAQKEKLDTYSVFKKINKGCCVGGAISYPMSSSVRVRLMRWKLRQLRSMSSACCM